MVERSKNPVALIIYQTIYTLPDNLIMERP